MFGIDLTEKILNYVRYEDLRACSKVCKKWHAILKDPNFWIKKSKEESVFLPKSETLMSLDCRLVYRYKPFGRNLIYNPSGLGKKIIMKQNFT